MDLKKSAIILPNAITLSSLFLGFYSIVMLADGRPEPVFAKAALALFFAMILDGLDGRVARMTNSQSEFGVQLDSLADLVSFGVAPAFLVYKWALFTYGGWGILGAFLFAGAGAVRLARFNCKAQDDGGCSRYFVGLPIPAAAGTIIAMVLVHEGIYGAGKMTSHSGVLLLVFLLAFLMVSNVRFRTFKDFRPSKRNLATVGALVLGLVVSGFAVHPWFPLVALFAMYLLSGLLGEVFFFVRKRRTA